LANLGPVDVGRIGSVAVLAGGFFIVLRALSGCSGSDCAAANERMLSIYVRDQATQQPICDATVLLTLDRQQMYADFTSGGTDCHFVGGYDPGTYQVEVSRTGYQKSTTMVVVPVIRDDPVCPQGAPQKATIDLKASM
jgi:hypothetical protein